MADVHATGVRWAIMGSGRIAGAFTRDVLRSGLIVQAVGSRSMETAQRFADTFGLRSAHGSYEELVADDEVDVVYIATPHSQHCSNAMMALGAGKHVLIEKPFALNASEAEQVAEFAADRQLVAMEAMWTRFLPHMARIRDLIESATIGDVLGLTADHTQLLSADPAHRINNLELGGGALLDLGVYPISFADELFGPPVTISAGATFGVTGVDTSVATIFGYGDGRLASTYAASVTKGPNVASILGTRGRIEIDAIWYSATDFTVYDSEDNIIERFISEVAGRGMQYQAFEAELLITSGRLTSDILPLSTSVRIMRVLDKVRSLIGLRYPSE